MSIILTLFEIQHKQNTSPPIRNALSHIYRIVPQAFFIGKTLEHRLILCILFILQNRKI